MRRISSLIIGTMVVTATPAMAQDVSLEIEVGALYDSHLTFEEADAEQQQGDVGARLRADVKVVPVDTKSFELDFRYTFDQTLYADFDEFDIQSHRLGTGVQTRIGGARLSLDYDFRHIRLGGDALYDEHSVTPSLAGFVAKDVYARAFYKYSDKNFDILERRDADGHTVGTSVMRFFSGRRGFVSGSVQYETQDAADPALDFEGYQLGVNARVPLSSARLGPRAKFGYSYRDRDYDNVTPSLGERRTETRSRFDAGLELPLNRQFRLEGDYRYTNRNSNFAPSDYNEHRVAVSVVFEL
ncbi:outer membrane beta-barrel protein [Sphingopyxis bauzanensis]|nr:outer membrane beta-barrel protein [Sphingopyxis bauzanensis]GGJ50545.1 hypothetical protein GCM10011393_20980 [Sphingopyxis bauzanensis]